jgi:hypothetical protein
VSDADDLTDDSNPLKISSSNNSNNNNLNINSNVIITPPISPRRINLSAQSSSTGDLAHNRRSDLNDTNAPLTPAPLPPTSKVMFLFFFVLV